MIPPLSFLHDKLTVKAVDDDRFSVTVVLPADLVRSYCLFLESLSNFFRFANRQGSIDKALVSSAELDAEAEAGKAAYQDRLVHAFDAYTARGMARNEAIKQISADLRSENHPWRAADLVRKTLVAAGRGGRSGRPRRGES
jgi:hypothetical protein